MNRTWQKADRIRMAIVLGGILLASAAHYTTPTPLLVWHVVFLRLYYLPIVYAALYFGWRGGLAAAALSGACYVPHILMAWQYASRYVIDQYAEIAVFFLVGFVTGLLADREQKQRRELKQNAEQLSKLYQELQDSFEQIKRADRLSGIGQLAASLAHEIRNPLAGIRGAVDVLDNAETSEELRHEFHSIIDRECGRLEKLLTGLLDFARPRTPEFVRVDIGQKLDSAIALVAHSAAKNKITVRKDVLDGTSSIECDPEQLQQVLLNLTLNAIQAMPEGGELLLSARQQGSNVLIQVRDQGHGINREDLDRIFDPFFTTKEQGTGLGLAVAHRIINQHNGTITVERNADKGMTFSILLPLRRDKGL